MMSTDSPAPELNLKPAPRPWWPYVLPMGAFLVLTTAEGWLPQAAKAGGGVGPHPTWYPLAYAAKAIVVGVLLVACRMAWADLRPRPGRSGWALAVGVGLAVCVAWVGLERLPYPKFGDATGGRQAFDPGVLAPATRAAFLAVRFLGLVLIVPVMEELFWRSFVNRLVIDTDDFGRVPIGKVTLASAAVTAGLFAASHPEWLPALLTGLAWAWLLHQTRSISACVVSHAVANLALGVYVMATGSWGLW
jgi:CAAX prenyl protease-like protein